jgi:hypothetical protein
MCILDGSLMIIIASTNHFMLIHFFGVWFSVIFAEGDFLRRKINSNPEEIDVTSFVKDIHGAPPESLVVKLAEVIGNFKTLREMAFFWCWFVAEVCFDLIIT